MVKADRQLRELKVAFMWGDEGDIPSILQYEIVNAGTRSN